MPAFPKLAVREKILLHLAALGPAGPGLAATQTGIANGIALHRGHVSRALDALQKEGLVLQQRQRVAGFQRTLLACSLTPNGEAAARALRVELEAMVVDVHAPDGHLVQKTLGDAVPARDAPAVWAAVQALEATGAVGSVQAGAPPPSTFALDLDEMPVVHEVLGRSMELDQLARWMRGLDPSCIILGPGGIGKSTLVAHAIQQVQPRRHTLWIRLAPGMKLEPFLARIDRFLSRLGRPMSASAAELPQAVMEQLPRRLHGIPLLVVVDNVHKADPDLYQAFERLAAAAEKASGLQVVWIGRTIRLPIPAVRRALRIELEPLAPPERVEFLRTLAVPAERRAVLAEQSGGNPLFLELLAAGRGVEGARESFVHYLTEELAGQASPAQLRLLQQLCALRSPITRARLEQLGAGEALDELVRSRLVAQLADGSLALHDEVHDAFYASLGEARRREVHARWAALFAPGTDAFDDAVEYLHHLALSGRKAEAAWWTLRHQTQLLEGARRKFRAAPDGLPAPGAPAPVRAPLA
jgi:DNA-binding MarR family transcriptional regulator